VLGLLDPAHLLPSGGSRAERLLTGYVTVRMLVLEGAASREVTWGATARPAPG